jgi:hypothetical protein
MSATVVRFHKFDYPGPLEPVRAQVLKALANEPDESRKIAACRYKSKCDSIYCPLCTRQYGRSCKGRILEASGALPPKRLRFATFTTRDVALGDLRATTGQIMDATRRTMKSLKVDGYAARLETSFEEWTDDYHPHIHALIDSPSGGRGFIPPAAFEHEWLAALQADLHPIEGGAHAKPVRILDAAAEYMFKSPFHQHVKSEEVARIVQTISATKGLQKVAFRGSMATPAQCAAA